MRKSWKALSLIGSAFVATSAVAGGLSPVVVEEVPVVEEKPASSLSPLVILGIILLVGFALSQNGENN